MHARLPNKGAIYVSSDYIVRQTIIRFTITITLSNNLFYDIAHTPFFLTTWPSWYYSFIVFPCQVTRGVLVKKRVAALKI